MVSPGAKLTTRKSSSAAEATTLRIRWFVRICAARCTCSQPDGVKRLARTARTTARCTVKCSSGRCRKISLKRAMLIARSTQLAVTQRTCSQRLIFKNYQ